MTPDEAQLVKYRLSRAEETLIEAKLMLEHGHLNSAVSRLYYACFYAVSALLYSEGYSSSKHSGVRALFDQHWIKSGRLPVEMGRFYRNLFDRRQECDYADFAQFERSDIEKWLTEARALVALVALEVGA